MKKIGILLLVLGIAASACKSNKTAQKVEEPEDNTIYEIVEKMPEYPGGVSERQKFIAKNLIYPPLAVENNLQGKVYISFVVEKDGTTSNHKIMRTFDEECSKECIRVVKLMQWLPAEHKGKTVRAKMTLPIIFKLR